MFFEGLALRLLGPTVEGARLTWALLGVATIPAIFWLGSQIRGTAAGLAAAALLATYHLHIHYSRIALNNIGDPLFLTLALCILLAAIRRRSLLLWGVLWDELRAGALFLSGRAARAAGGWRCRGADLPAR